MINNRIIQLFYRTIFIVFSFLACINSIYDLGTGEVYNYAFKYYTNISNYICFIVMLIVLIFNLKDVLKGNIYGFNNKLITIKFLSTILILVTFVVYNIALLSTITKDTNYFKFSNMLTHFICPLMFVLDFFLFDKHHVVKVRDIFLSTIVPLIYVIAILVVGAFYKPFIYPYFFLNPKSEGYLKVFFYVLGLVASFIVIGFLFYLYDKISKKGKKYVLDIKGKYKDNNI